MEKLTIRLIAIDDIEHAPNVVELCSEYLGESGVPGLPQISVDFEAYRNAERAGLLSSVGAFAGGALIGFILTSTSVMPNYGVKVAVINAFFVLKPHRKTGAGLRLLHEAEKLAIESGAAGVLIGCPKDGALSGVLERKHYSDVNRLFFKALP